MVPITELCHGTYLILNRPTITVRQAEKLSCEDLFLATCKENLLPTSPKAIVNTNVKRKQYLMNSASTIVTNAANIGKGGISSSGPGRHGQRVDMACELLSSVAYYICPRPVGCATSIYPTLQFQWRPHSGKIGEH